MPELHSEGSAEVARLGERLDGAEGLGPRTPNAPSPSGRKSMTSRRRWPGRSAELSVTGLGLAGSSGRRSCRPDRTIRRIPPAGNSGRTARRIVAEAKAMLADESPHRLPISTPCRRRPRPSAGRSRRQPRRLSRRGRTRSPGSPGRWTGRRRRERFRRSTPRAAASLRTWPGSLPGTRRFRTPTRTPSGRGWTVTLRRRNWCGRSGTGPGRPAN